MPVTRHSPLPLGRADGFTYLAVLFAVALLGIALAATGAYWHIEKTRAQEQQLLYIGHQFREAIRLYYTKSPGLVKEYPPSFKELLQDPRFVGIERRLRKIYRDPITNNTLWGIVRAPDGGIMGVYSLSEARPLKKGNFRAMYKDFEGKTRYRDWQFVYRPSISEQPPR